MKQIAVMRIKRKYIFIGFNLFLLVAFSGCALPRLENTNSYYNHESINTKKDNHHFKVNRLANTDKVVRRIEDKISFVSHSALQQLLIKAGEEGKIISFPANYRDFLLDFNPYDINLYTLIYKISENPMVSNIYFKNNIVDNNIQAKLFLKYKYGSTKDDMFAFEKKAVAINNNNIFLLFRKLGFGLIDKTEKNISISFRKNQKYTILSALNSMVEQARQQNISLYIKYNAQNNIFVISDKQPFKIHFIDYFFKDIKKKYENHDFDFDGFKLFFDNKTKSISYNGCAQIAIYLSTIKEQEKKYGYFYFGVYRLKKNLNHDYSIIKSGFHPLNKINVFLLSIKNIKKFLVVDREKRVNYIVFTNKKYFIIDNKYLIVAQ